MRGTVAKRLRETAHRLTIGKPWVSHTRGKPVTRLLPTPHGVPVKYEFTGEVRLTPLCGREIYQRLKKWHKRTHA